MNAYANARVGFDEAVSRARDTIVALGQNGSAVEADHHALTVFRELSTNLALALGQERLQRASARRAGAMDGVVAADHLSPNSNTANGDIARALVDLALDLAAPALPPGAADLLAGAIRQQGSGDRTPTILDHAVPKQVHGRALFQNDYVALVRAIAVLIRGGARGAGGPGDEAEAWRRLTLLALTRKPGKSKPKVPSREDIEIALLTRAKASITRGTWQDIKDRQRPGMRMAVDILAAMLADKLTPDQERELLDNPDCRPVVSALLAKASLAADFDRQIEYVAGARDKAAGNQPRKR